jgi:hypothetical protein
MYNAGEVVGKSGRLAVGGVVNLFAGMVGGADPDGKAKRTVVAVGGWFKAVGTKAVEDVRKA